jgi:colanic acid/amylovoran biosynthesis protein
LILLRDQQSKASILDLGVENQNIYTTADAAFALANPDALKKAQNVSASLPSSPQIAISVRDWKHFKSLDPKTGREKYLQAICDASSHLIREYGAKITFLSTCQGIPEYWTDDSKVAIEIVGKLPFEYRDFVKINREFHSPESLSMQLPEFDFVISTRLHMAILSMGVGVPVLPIAYEFKTKELFSKLGYGYLVQDIEEISSDSLIHTVNSFISSINEIRENIMPQIQLEYEQALESGRIVMKLLNK